MGERRMTVLEGLPARQAASVEGQGQAQTRGQKGQVGGCGRDRRKAWGQESGKDEEADRLGGEAAQGWEGRGNRVLETQGPPATSSQTLKLLCVVTYAH